MNDSVASTTRAPHGGRRGNDSGNIGSRRCAGGGGESAATGEDDGTTGRRRVGWGIGAARRGAEREKNSISERERRGSGRGSKEVPSRGG